MSAHAQQPFADEIPAERQPVVHQALRRDVNEEIVGVDRGLGIADAELVAAVLCECVYADCDARIELTRAEYETVRRFPSRFLVKAGHEVAEDERILADSDRYLVVEKLGLAGSFAVGADPRRRHRTRARRRDDAALPKPAQEAARARG